MSAVSSLAPSQALRIETMPLGMAQLAYRGVSEDWWLRHLGDVHWQLIADAVGQHTTVFRDADGRQMYAAFCATEFDQSRPNDVSLGKTVEIQSELFSASKSRLQSNHRLLCDGTEIAQFRFVSTFVVHKTPGINASVSRATPYLIPVLGSAPDDFARYASVFAKTSRAQSFDTGSAVTLYPSIGVDFNAVGLLYFPAYTRLLDQAERQWADHTTWSPVRHRLVVYFGNIEPQDRVVAQRSMSEPESIGLWSAPKSGAYSSQIAHGVCQRF